MSKPTPFTGAWSDIQLALGNVVVRAAVVQRADRRAALTQLIAEAQQTSQGALDREAQAAKDEQHSHRQDDGHEVPGRAPGVRSAGRRPGFRRQSIRRPLWLLIPPGVLMVVIIGVPLVLAVSCR